MEHDEEEDVPSTVISLADLLENLKLTRSNKTNVRFLQFEYFDWMLTRTHLPSWLDFISWMLYFMIIEVILTATSIQAHFFGTLNSTNWTKDTKSTDFLFSKVTIQLATIILFTFTLCLIIFQRPFAFTINFKNSSMTHFRASLLHFSYVHIPILLSPVFGILLGSHILANVGSETEDTTATYYALLACTTYILLLSSVSAFVAVINSKLTITNTPFAFWKYPYNFVDLLFFYLIGAFFPLRSSPAEKVVIAMMIIQFFYGIYFLIRRRTPVFLYLTPAVLEIKMGVDYILFSILTITNILSSVNYLSYLSLVCTAHFVSIMITTFLISRNRVLRSLILKHHTYQIDRNSISSPSNAVITLRSGITLSIPSIADPAFIKWIALCRYTHELLPDLFRICLISKIPLKEVLIPHTAIGPTNLISLQFLVFQANYYLEMINDESLVLRNTYEKLLKKTEKIEIMLNNFWTTADYDQTTFYKLGCNIYDVKNDFEDAIVYFPLSKEIHNLYKNFLANILKTPRLIEFDKKNPYYHLSNPKSTVYECIINKSHSQTIFESRPKPTTNEKIALDTIKKGTLPILNFFRVIALVSIFNSFVYWGLYYDHIGNTWNCYSNVTQFQQANVALATSLLLPTDELMTFPDAQKIQLIIGVPLNLAALFRAPMSFDNPFISLINDIVYYLPPNYLSFRMNANCSKMSYSATTAFNIRNESRIEKRRCYLMNVLRYMDLLENCTAEQFDIFKRYVNHSYSLETYFQVSYAVVVTIIFIIIFTYMRKKHDELLCAARLVLSAQENYHENEYLEMQFWVCPTFTIFIVYVACTFGLFLAFIFPLYKSDKFVETIINETVAATRIARGIQNGMTLAEFSIKDSEYRSEYERITKNMCIDVYVNTLALTHNDISKTFSKIEPFNNWSQPSRTSYNTVLLDVCRFLIQGNHSEESFDFLAARAYFIYNITSLLSYTLPEMRQSAHYAMQFETSSFWWITILITVIIVALNLLYKHLIYQRKKIWFTAVSTVLLRAHQGDMKNLVQRKKVTLPDLAPFPILLKQKNTGTIMYANPATKQYTDLSIGQLIGQRVHEVWNIDDNNKFTANDKTVIITEKKIDNGLSMIMFDDITEINEIEEKYNSLISQKQIRGINLPAEIEMFAIEIRIKADIVDSDKLFNILDSTEPKCRALIRVSCGPSFYNAIIPADCKFSRVISFLKAFGEQLGDFSNIIVSVIHSIGKVVSVCDCDAIALVCGKAAKRVHDCVLHGTWGRIYIDYELLEQTKPRKYSALADKIIMISDTINPSNH
ncbi:hypothetical protein TRFO_01115 [Tritrichomonas foetus]|uniref:PAS domain-containing protein n=1 Tax=Tritrichomonas foetus TaxID=1144522 RepID=A0A1J4KN12_9EUKA|nr:hypothetical protein TRFO_01115 [Tritrichomonas foetus]|eukprot:OHT11188.1 hypothetical protein TRFO_01115 [Tritrichomonas foetus]